MTHSEIKKLLDNITQGEWSIDDRDEIVTDLPEDKLKGEYAGWIVITDGGCYPPYGDDLKFIAAAPSIVRQLLQELESAHAHAADFAADCERLKEQLDKATNDAGNYAAKCVILEQKIEQLEARHVQLIDEANKSMLQAHDYMNKLLNLEAVRKAAEKWLEGSGEMHTLTSLKQALNQLEPMAHNKGE